MKKLFSFGVGLFILFELTNVYFIMPMPGSQRTEMNRLVVGIDINGEARAFPVRFIGYHHQVRDTVAGQPVMVSYCTVCRTGRVFSPVVDGHPESFRLVGMDHFNAMFEDRTTGSWWRQANGEAIAGPAKDNRSAGKARLADWSRSVRHRSSGTAGERFSQRQRGTEPASVANG